MPDAIQTAIAEIWRALGGGSEWPGCLTVRGDGGLPSVFAVSDLAGASVGVAGLAVAELMHARRGGLPRATVDRQLASFWFGSSIRLQGWALPPAWDAVAGDYRAADGWIKLHTNAPHHRAAALAVLDVPAERDRVAQAVSRWPANALEQAVVDAGGCAAAMRDMSAWAAHPQGRAVAAEPLLTIEPGDPGPAPSWTVPKGAPLQGVRVLDMTRVLAGPVATRFLAGFGAEVLRINPPGWDEPGLAPDVTLGKQCARLDLRQPGDRTTWEGLLARADVLVHGYRPDALARLGLDAARRHGLRPGLIDVSLDAYGWSGPWQGRRGFDSLVQMSCGLAEAGMRRMGRDRPTPLPVQALDHATGYIMAAAAVRGLTGRLSTGAGYTVRASLAGTAALLTGLPPGDPGPLAPETPGDFADAAEATAWGPALRVRPPCEVEGAPMRWRRPAAPLGSAAPSWAG
jgi:crotonobetainyl-CoA:carnitine CoA-transferase CaiB-like acyl-CoA transferase